MSNYNLIVGPTGVGKSSLIDYIQHQVQCAVYSDPYQENPFIKDAYLAKTKCFQSQIFFFKEFLKIHKEIKSQFKMVFQERSIYESVYIFCANLLREGSFTKEEYKVFEDLLNEVSEVVSIPDQIIMLTASTETILERISSRGRDFEKDIQSQFIESQKILYQQWLSMVSSEWSCKIRVIDTDTLSIEDVGEIVLTEVNNNHI